MRVSAPSGRRLRPPRPPGSRAAVGLALARYYIVRYFNGHSQDRAAKCVPTFTVNNIVYTVHFLNILTKFTNTFTADTLDTATRAVDTFIQSHRRH